MSGSIAACLCVEIEALLTDVGWNPTIRVTVRPEYTLPVGTYSDHVCCEGGEQPRQPLNQRVSE